jgi:hypothetical protein
MHGYGPHQGGGQLSDGDKSLVIKANSLSGNVVVLRAPGVQDTTPNVQDTAPDVQDTAPDAENAG